MHQTSEQDNPSFWRRLDRRVFRERQILLRSDDRVRCLHLRPGPQKVAAAGLAIALAWLAVASAGVLWQQERLSQRSEDLARARAAYAELSAGLEAARSETEALLSRFDGEMAEVRGLSETAELPRFLGQLRLGLASLSVRNKALSERVSQVRDDLRGAKARAETLVAARQRLQGALAETRRTLDDVVDRREALADRLRKARDDLKTLRASRQAEAAGRLQAERTATRLSDDLAETRRDEAELRRRLGTLERQLARSNAARSALAGQRRDLAERIAALEKLMGMENTQGREGDLAGRIAGLEDALVANESRVADLAGERDRLQGKVNLLQERLASLRESQSGLFAHYSERTRDGLAAIEKTVGMTGLDVNDLVTRVRAERARLGGPFVAATWDAGSELGQSARLLDRRMTRLFALQAALGSLPLVAPLDSYWISSYFGGRRDPYNGQWAQHEGIDLAAQAGSPVYAAAPGMVVHAGRKSGYGRLVEIEHGYGIRTRYAHLRSIAVRVGTRIEHRQKIGQVGNSGRSTGPHVHYEILVDGEPLDPMNFLEAGKHVFKG